MSFQKKLAGMQKKWSAARTTVGTSASGFITLPAGIYALLLANICVDADKNGALTVKRKWEVSDGDLQGNVVYDNIPIEAQDWGIEACMKFLNFLGYVDADIADLEDLCDKITEQQFVIKSQVKIKNDFNQIFQQEVLSCNDTDASAPPPAPEPTPAPATETKAPKAPRKAKAPAPASAPSVDVPALVKFCESYGLEPSDKSVEALTSAIRGEVGNEYQWTAADLEPGEKELLETVGVKVS
jgi:hypothetical protein